MLGSASAWEHVLSERLFEPPREGFPGQVLDIYSLEFSGFGPKDFCKLGWRLTLHFIQHMILPFFEQSILRDKFLVFGSLLHITLWVSLFLVPIWEFPPWQYLKLEYERIAPLLRSKRAAWPLWCFWCHCQPGTEARKPLSNWDRQYQRCSSSYLRLNRITYFAPSETKWLL